MSTLPSSEPFLEAVARRLDAVPAVEMQGPPRWKQIRSTSRAPRRGRTSRVRLAGIATSLTCVVAVGVAVLALAGSSSVDTANAALPVFKRPVVDATRLRPLTPVLARQQARYANARKIATASGPGYVMPAAGGRVCLAVPDPGNGYGESCATAEQIEERGLPVILTSDTSGVMAAVVPKTASDAVLHLADGNARKLDIVDGVITAAASGKANVSFRVGSRLVSVPLHFDLACVQVDSNDPVPTADLKGAVHEAGRRFCDEDASSTAP